MTETLSISEVRNFWENNPLWTGESSFTPGSIEFFEEHRSVVIQDVMAGTFDRRYLPDLAHQEFVLDLGCGPGFWTIELGKNGCSKIMAADLTEQAVELTQKRCTLFQINAEASVQNAEQMTFPDKTFTHVNCQGVIHHTPNTEVCIQEIHRVLKDGGTASISVYHKNIFLKSWPILKWFFKVFNAFAPKLKGRGRESIAQLSDVNEIVRLFDGAENPIGKAYTKNEFLKMVQPYFEVLDCYLHFFPARTLPITIPKWCHRWLDKNLGFMIVLNLQKVQQR